jgi:splicing factor 3B subunit 3
MTSFAGRLLVGLGRSLRLYELGKKQLLRKCETRGFPSAVVRLDTHGDRIFVGDMAESVFFVKYKKMENAFVIFAEDVIPRWTNTLCALDHHTVCGSDKFGNVFVLRADEHADDDVDYSTGARTQWEAGSRSHLVQECHYYLGDIVTSMRKAQFVPEGKDMVLVATLGGALHALLPITNKADLLFFGALEAFVRKEVSSICGRSHQSYRSFYQPVRHVIDGDFCEQFCSLPYPKQAAFAEEQGRTVPDVLKKLEDMREVV